MHHPQHRKRHPATGAYVPQEHMPRGWEFAAEFLGEVEPVDDAERWIDPWTGHVRSEPIEEEGD